MRTFKSLGVGTIAFIVAGALQVALQELGFTSDQSSLIAGIVGGIVTWLTALKSGWSYSVLWGLLGVAGPFGAFVFWGFWSWQRTETKITDLLKMQCLAYLKNESELARFQTEEADKYNNALVTYAASVATSPEARQHVADAALKLAASVKEILRRRPDFEPIPEVAMGAYVAWLQAYYDYSAWAESQAAATQAINEGFVPHWGRVKELFKQSEMSRKKAEEQQKKLARRLGLNASEIVTMLRD